MGKRDRRNENEKKSIIIGDKKFIEISKSSCCYETLEIPVGATHVEAEVNYDDCWYQGDVPSVRVIFYKEEE
jgi:hypothetical protein